MLERIQKQAIVDRLKGLVPDIRPDAMDEPWRSIFLGIPDVDPDEQAQVEALGGDYIQRLLWRAVYENVKDRDRCIPLCDELTALLDADERWFPSLAEIADSLPPIDWLWPSWIPRSMITLLGAIPGAGKSLVALDLARRIIQADHFPDGYPPPNPGAPVLYVDAEAIPQLHQSRAEAWNLDTERLFLMLPKRFGMIDFAEPWDRDRLLDMMSTISPELLIIDSLSTISSRGENNVEDVRRVLGFLTDVAHLYDCGLILIHHLRKRGKANTSDIITVDDFRGSSHIMAMSRSVMALSVVQDSAEYNRDGPRRLEIVKANLCKHPRPLGVHFERHGFGVRLDYTSDVPRPYKEPNMTDDCADWILGLLEEAGEPVSPKDLLAAAEEAGFKPGIVRRARRALDDQVVDTEDCKYSPTNRWALAQWITDDKATS